MGSSLSPILSNIFLVHSEKLALDSAQHKPSLWLQYVEDTFVVWPHGQEQLENFLSHPNSLRHSIQFTKKIVRQCTSFSGCSGHQERDDTCQQSLQKTHPHWPISQLQI
jgi:hypothetical protein